MADLPLVTPGIEFVTGAPPRIEEALLGRIAKIRAVSPLAPIDVLVGGVLQRPYLQRRAADTAGVVLNVRFSTIGELGLRLGEAKLIAAGRRPLTAIAERGFAGEIARATTGYFEPVADTPGFAEAARRLVRELRQEAISPELFASLTPDASESEQKAATLTDLYARYIGRRAERFDGEDALAVADPDRFDGTALLVFGVWRLGAHARTLIANLARHVPVTFFLPSVGADADQATEGLTTWLAAQGAGHTALEPAAPATALEHVQRELFAPVDAIASDETIRLVSAPDPLTETREAARTCLDWARMGVPFRGMAVTYRDAQVYRPLVEAVFSEAGIPVYLDDGPSVAERPLGRRILALLDLIDSQFARRDVMAFLSDGWLPRETRERYRKTAISRWESASRRAGVVQGLDQWRERLGSLIERNGPRPLPRVRRTGLQTASRTEGRCRGTREKPRLSRSGSKRKYRQGGCARGDRDRAEFDAAQSTTKSQLPQRNGSVAAQAMLGGLARCAGCGHTLKITGNTDRKTGSRYPIYYCTGRFASGPCPSRATARASLVDGYVEEQIRSALTEDGGVLAQAVAASEAIEAAAVSEAEHELELFVNNPRLMTLLGEARFVDGVETRQRALDDARAALSELRRQSDLATELSHGDLIRAWPTLEVGEKRRLMFGLLEQVLVTRATGRGRHAEPIAERVEIVLRGGIALPIETPAKG